jgi:hypothetical protein
MMFEPVKQSEEQSKTVSRLYAAAQTYADALAEILPEGPDKTWCIRNHRTTAMWATMTVMRLPDGTPRPHGET